MSITEANVLLGCDGSDCEADLFVTVDVTEGQKIDLAAVAAVAGEEGWLAEGGRHLCPDCRPDPEEDEDVESDDAG